MFLSQASTLLFHQLTSTINLTIMYAMTKPAHLQARKKSIFKKMDDKIRIKHSPKFQAGFAIT